MNKTVAATLKSPSPRAIILGACLLADSFILRRASKIPEKNRRKI